jgi:glucan-binding YG repeat protein
MVRCGDQTCAESHDKCPALVVCDDANAVVCPDGTCKQSELDCHVPAICSGDNNIQCPDGTCVNDTKNCMKGIICGNGLALCSDGKCKEICNINKVENVQLTAEEIALRMKPNYLLQKLQEEQEKLRQEQIKKDKEEAARIAAEEEKRKKDEEAKAAAEELRKKEEARKIQEAVDKAKKEADEKARKAAEAEAQRRKDEEAARQRAEAEAAVRRVREAEEAARVVAENTRLQAVKSNKAWMANNVHSGIPFYTFIGTQVLAGRRVKIIHWNTKKVLHSHGSRYNTGSREQEVTGYWTRDDNDWFYVDVVSGGVVNGGVISLRHQSTGRSIFIDNGQRSPASNQLECSTRPRNGSDERFNFRIEMNNSWFGDNNLRIGDLIRLINVGTNAALHSHGINNYVSQQQEVTGFGGRDTNDLWIVVETN